MSVSTTFPRLHSFAYGLTLPALALRVIVAHRQLLLWSILPILITGLLYFYGLGFLRQEMHDLLRNWFLAQGWQTEGWVFWLVDIASRVSLFLAAILTFSLAAAVAASPFNDFLAESAEQFSIPPLPPAEPTSIFAKVGLLFVDFGKSLMAMMGALAALLFSWIPGLNFLAFGVAFLLLTFQYVSYPQTRRGQGLRESARFLADHFFSCLGLGMSLSFLFSIPLLSLLAMPIAVVSGTLLFARAEVEPRLR